MAATPPPATGGTPQLVAVGTAPLHIVSINAAVAKAHGYVVRTAPNGLRYSVKASARGAAAAPTPLNEVTGDCGDSYLYYYAVGGKEAYVDTGWNVTPAAAWDYSWTVAVVDNAGTGRNSWGGFLAGDWNWATDWLTKHSVTGYSWAEVVSGEVSLLNGDECSSLNPWDWTNLY